MVDIRTLGTYWTRMLWSDDGYRWDLNYVPVINDICEEFSKEFYTRKFILLAWELIVYRRCHAAFCWS
jgi:hypothetical protein